MKFSPRAYSSIALSALLAIIFVTFSWYFISLEEHDAGSSLPQHVHHTSGEPDIFFDDLLKIYTPRRVCMFYETPVIWLHFISDLFIALAYYSIPFALIYFVRRRKDLAFGWVFLLFALFILACGTTHIFGALDLWFPLYRIEGGIKLVTAILSLLTAVALWPLLPKALLIPSVSSLERAVAQRTSELEETNAALVRSEQQAKIALQELERTKASERENLMLLSQNERLFYQLANSIPQLAWMADADGSIFWYNDRWYDYTGKTEEEMKGWGWKSIQDPEILPLLLERWQHSLSTGEVFSMTFPLRSADGRFIPFLTRAIPFKDVNSKITMWFGTNTDVSEEKKREEEKQRVLEVERAARLSAEKAGTLKDEFLATLSHELRTPLNAIVGWSQVLKRLETKNEKVIEGVTVIERNARIQVQIIDDLLDMSRIISGNFRIDVQKIDLREVIIAAVDTLLPTAEAKEIKISKILDSSVGPIRGDAARLQQVLWNLVTNALKFTPRGGSIQIALERVNSHVELTVSDSGIGIEPDFLPFVFDRFRQADSSSTRMQGGLGLGLAIVKKLIELHGGSVRAKSAGQGRGASFSVELPLTALHPESSGDISIDKAGDLVRANEIPRPTPSKDALDGISILVLDDEKDSREIVKVILEEYGARVFLASSVSQAVNLVKSSHPQIIISDIGMPEEDGYSFIRKVRKLSDEEGGTTPAIALTAFARSEDRKNAFLSGFQVHVTKPVESDELVAVVVSLAGRVNKNV